MRPPAPVVGHPVVRVVRADLVDVAANGFLATSAEAYKPHPDLLLVRPLHDGFHVRKIEECNIAEELLSVPLEPLEVPEHFGLGGVPTQQRAAFMRDVCPCLVELLLQHER